ncbi:MAG TPA: succinylglutamate desuccinylase/aspartoacylase family protein [Thermoanaerobaculia bacterium]|nr:succinylglutamate desuccinylase/aspartoacylase family protein [Thermoanaerobaculia bacterium]
MTEGPAEPPAPPPEQPPATDDPQLAASQQPGEIGEPQLAAPPAPTDLLRIGDKMVPPGSAVRIDLPVARLFTGGWLSLPVTALQGARPGPRLWLDAAIHGDELNGMEIIRRVLAVLDPARLAGAVIAVPVVNVFGFVQQTRYLPDRRDLNRSFPGSARGSMAARLARLFIEQTVAKCGYGIDLHTGSQHRTNLPQIRAHLADPETRRIAEAFAAPMMYTAAEIPGSLRAAARRRGVHLLVYEAGEPLRFDEAGIRAGVDGVLRVLAALGMWEAPEGPPPPRSFEAEEAAWVRARRSGIFHHSAKLGEPVKRHQQLGYITPPWGNETTPVKAPFEGIVIGFTSNPLVYRGDALLHVARAARAPSRPARV